MAIYEHTGVLTYKDKDANLHRMFPIIKKECIAGFDDVDQHIVDTENPHNVNIGQIGAASVERTINGHPLSKDVVITTNDLGITLDDTLSISGGYAESTAVKASIDNASANLLSEIMEVRAVANNAMSTATKKTSMKTATIKLLKEVWSEKQQTVSADGVTDANTIIVGSHPDNSTDYGLMGVQCIKQDFDSVTFSCIETPGVDLLVNIIIFN